MRRRAVLLIVLALGAGCDAGAPQTSAEFESCHRLQIIDSQTGMPVQGLEDMVVTSSGKWALASAYDRWGAEDAAEQNASSIPSGGLYLIPLDADVLSGTQLSLHNIAEKFSQAQDFHPHGIDLYAGPDGRETLAVINRRYQREQPTSPWALTTTLEVFTLEDQNLSHETTVASGQLCRTNDVLALSETKFLVSRDHGACTGLGALMEDVFGLDRSKILRISLRDQDDETPTIDLAADGIAFANGLALDAKNGVVYVAATRGESVLTYRLEDLLQTPPAKPVARFATKAGPDNLSWSQEDHLIVALHPSLWRLGFYRKRWLGVTQAPSQIVSVDLTDQTLTSLFSGTEGEHFSAATVGIQTNGLLIMGSVAETGVMVCVGGATAPLNRES